MACAKWIVLLGGFLFVATAGAAPDASRPASLGDVLVPPEVIMQHADELGIDDAQKEAIHAEFEKAKERFPDLQQNLQKEVAALTEMMSQQSIDQKKAVGQLDKVLDAEREIKRAHLTLVLAIREKLKPEQLKKLSELREKWNSEAHAKNPGQGDGQIPQTLQTKMQHLRERAEHAQRDGKDLSDLRSVMEEFQPLMEQKKFKEAEAVLDHGLKTLDEIDKK
ncbi:MAG TPA: periplasmic heavy metal sensor [Tepidisphaeraceae bacterium]|jgi:Spy/CpxP family protein refolding chaperone|nr:periplasmic heavy metal sensor [Tepidisphaeraceae bacterium]